MATQRADLETASRMARFEPSKAVTDILKLAERPDVISLAGGLPDPTIFPLELVRESMARVLEEDGASALNYGPNPGFTKLREWIAERMMERDKTPTGVENVIVTSGGVEGLNLVSMSLLDEGDVVLVESPTYMVALHVFHTYGARIIPVESDDEGLSVDALEEHLIRLEQAGIKPRFLYVIPTFQNPSGRTMSEERRRKLVTLGRERGLPIVEDHAYAELSYDGPAPPSLKSLDPEGVMLIHTFSKIFGPGVRLGWVASSPAMVERLGLCKLGTDQCSNTLTQRLVYDYGRDGHIDEQVERSLSVYRRKRDALIGAMKKHFPKEASWIHPGGGFFVWVRLASGANSEAILARAISQEKTAFVAGPPFFVDGSGSEFMRLSFSFVPESQIEEGVRRIARALG